MTYYFCCHFEGDTAQGTKAEERKRILDKLDDLLREVLLGNKENRQEALLWLTTAVTQLSSPAPEVVTKKFFKLLEARTYTRNDWRRTFRLQFLQLACEHAPEKVAATLLTEPKVFRAFFANKGLGDSHCEQRINLWFNHFRLDNAPTFTRGAKALARYAFMHREQVWDLLVWAGKHPQSPISVVAKPHYWAELAVIPTIQRFLDDCPDFWSSEELLDTFKSGAFLAMDYRFFLEELEPMLQSRSRTGEMLQGVLSHVIAEYNFNKLCRSLLPLLPEEDLLGFANGLCLGSPKDIRSLEATQVAVFGISKWRHIDDLLVAVGLGLKGPSLWNLLQDEDLEAVFQDVVIAVRELNEEELSHAFWASLKQAAERSRTEGVRALLLEGFVLRASLLTCAKEGLPAVREGCRQNNIEFDLLDQGADDWEDSDAASTEGRTKKLKKQKRRKRKREERGPEAKVKNKRRRRHTTHELAGWREDDSSDDGGESGERNRAKGLRHSWPFQGMGDSGDSAVSGSVSHSWVLKHEEWSSVCNSKTFAPCIWEFATQNWFRWFFRNLRD
eukprot:jgi/Botrbrau1/14315/Bobra.0287s0008.1